MNKLVIIAGLVGLAVGGAGGYLTCHFVDKKKIDTEISKGIQSALDEIRSNQKQKAIENDAKKAEMIKTTGKNINAIPHFNAVDVVGEIAKENGYLPKDTKVEQPSMERTGPQDDEPDSDLPFVEGKEVEHSIWDEEDPDPNELTQEDYDNLQEPDISDFARGLDPTKPPYTITKDQYSEELQQESADGFWDKLTLIYFTDRVFAERVRYNEYQMMTAEQIEKAIGKSNMARFIDDRELERLYVRNNRIHIDYEIVRSSRSYTSAMHELDDEE